MKKFPRRYPKPYTYSEVLQLFKGKKTDCPHCRHKNIVRFGMYRDRQRYKCKNCLRTFNDLTSTPLHWTHHLQKFIDFLKCILNGYSLILSALEVRVSLTTAFYWRHKIINALDQAEVAHGVFQIKPNWKHQYINFRTGCPIPLPSFYPDEKVTFQQWMGYFNWTAFKYFTRYVAWFRWIEFLKKEPTKLAMEKLIYRASSVPLNQTYATCSTGTP